MMQKVGVVKEGYACPTAAMARSLTMQPELVGLEDGGDCTPPALKDTVQG